MLFIVNPQENMKVCTRSLILLFSFHEHCAISWNQPRHTSGVFLGCKTRVWIFLYHAEIFYPHAKVFECYVMNFSKILLKSNSLPNIIFVKVGKNVKAAKNFSNLSEIYAWSCKNHFLQPRKPRLQSLKSGT